MKRITLLMCALLAGVALQAQSPIIDQPGDSGSGFISDYFNLGTPTGVYLADDFTFSGAGTVSSVSVYGFQNGGNLDTFLTGFSLYIYADNGGEPAGNPSMAGAGVFEAINLAPTDPALTITGGTNFTVDVAALNGGTSLDLAAGTYWVVAVPQLDLDLAAAQNTEIWYWFLSTAANGGDALLIDPSDALGGGAITWVSLPTFLEDPTANALGFTVNGTDMSVSNNILPQISLYPNPVQDQLSINLPASVELESATMFDLLGQQTVMNISENNTLNTSNLASGVYILKLETNQGTMTKKVIKQ